MQKERKVIESNAVIVFDRDVNASELNMLTKEFSGDIVILEELLINENLHVKNNLHIMRDIVCYSENEINVDGDLQCYSEIGGYNIWVSGCLYCKGTISSDNINVGESFCCENRIEAYGGKITVMGDFECHGVKAKTVTVLGRIAMEGSVFVRNFIRGGY